jgi:hypothetical protein
MDVTLKRKLGCWLNERWKTEIVLSPRLSKLFGIKWIDLCNRNEHLLKGDGADARACMWEDSSFLTVARFFPRVGGRLLKHCLKRWPICLREEMPQSWIDKTAKISVILPVGTEDRIALFKTVLMSFLGQDYQAMEILVVECSARPAYKDVLPRGVKYIFVDDKSDNAGFKKSLAMNIGVDNADSRYVLLHDADTVVPSAYVRSITFHLDAGWDAVQPVRFLFHLNKYDTKKFISMKKMYFPRNVELLQQNFPGLSTAILKSVYQSIGGHDESFVGWGGEDLEFLDRLKTVNLFSGNYASAVHLWHSPAQKKASGDRNNLIMSQKRALSPQERIIELLKRI